MAELVLGVETGFSIIIKPGKSSYLDPIIPNSGEYVQIKPTLRVHGNPCREAIEEIANWAKLRVGCVQESREYAYRSECGQWVGWIRKKCFTIQEYPYV